MLSQDEIKDIREKVEDKSCEICHHFAVCKIYHGFLLHLKSIEVKEIKPTSIAKICPFYMPVVVGGE